MYKCQKCGYVVGPGKEMNKVVTMTRDVNYEIMKQANDREGKKINGKFFLQKVVKGTEIVKEECVCDRCAKKLKRRGPINIGKADQSRLVYK